MCNFVYGNVLIQQQKKIGKLRREGTYINHVEEGKRKRYTDLYENRLLLKKAKSKLAPPKK